MKNCFSFVSILDHNLPLHRGVLLADLTGLMMFDGIASVVIGLILGATAVWLAWETKGLLIGEAANQRVVDGIRRLLDDSEAAFQVGDQAQPSRKPST